MKNIKSKIALLILPVAGSFIMACNGDHSTKAGSDTAKQHYDAPSNVDTTKPSTPAGDAALDNSGSGGTKIAKDSTRADSTHK